MHAPTYDYFPTTKNTMIYYLQLNAQHVIIATWQENAIEESKANDRDRREILFRQGDCRPSQSLRRDNQAIYQDWGFRSLCSRGFSHLGICIASIPRTPQKQAQDTKIAGFDQHHNVSAVQLLPIIFQTLSSSFSTTCLLVVYIIACRNARCVQSSMACVGEQIL